MTGQVVDRSNESRLMAAVEADPNAGSPAAVYGVRRGALLAVLFFALTPARARG